MALYALDEDSNVVFASNAAPSQRYRCLECRGFVRKRASLHKRSHFCHLRNTPQCRLHSKSEGHLVLQTSLQERIPGLEMERLFPSILRIADLCWEAEKIVFEIQCSPITIYEAERRRRDYWSEGFDLVWLLDDRLFNRKTLRVAEEPLRKRAGYFISLRRAVVYDQFELFDGMKRLGKGPPLPVELSRPVTLRSKLPPLRQLQERHVTRCFQGDLVDRTFKSKGYLEQLLQQEQFLLEGCSKERWSWLKKPFHIGLEYLLRKTAASDGF